MVHCNDVKLFVYDGNSHVIGNQADRLTNVDGYSKEILFEQKLHLNVHWFAYWLSKGNSAKLKYFDFITMPLDTTHVYRSAQYEEIERTDRFR